MSLLILPILLILFYVLLILPQQRRVKAHQALVASLEVGDEVMTTSGIFGHITAIDGDTLHVEVAPDVELRITRSAIGRRVEQPGADEEPEALESGEPDDRDADTTSDDTREPVAREASEAEDR